MRALLVLLPLLCAPLTAQIQLYRIESGAEQPVGSVLDVGSAAISDRYDTKFRIRNIGSTAVTLQALWVRGTGFTMSGQPSLPHIVAPSSNFEFTVRFAPVDFGSYSATLTVNSISVLLRGASRAVPVVSMEGGLANPLVSGATVDVGRTERKIPLTRRFKLQNTTATERLAVRSVQLTGAGFTGPVGLALPLTLEPGSAIEFDVVFDPVISGIATGQLAVDERTFQLVGAAIEPPFSRPLVEVDASTLSSAQQGRVLVKFGARSRAAGAGTLRIEFRPSNAPDNDAAIQFLANSTRQLSFSVEEGDEQVRFGSAREVVFQTGTTAGALVFTAQVGGYTEQAIVTIPGSAVALDQSRALANGSNLEIVLSGYDNTRTAGKLSFIFYDRGGRPLSQGAIQVDRSDAFSRYFLDSKLGGLFSLKAVFPVTGPIGEISAVEVQLENSAGTARTAQLRF